MNFKQLVDWLLQRQPQGPGLDDEALADLRARNTSMDTLLQLAEQSSLEYPHVTIKTSPELDAMNKVAIHVSWPDTMPNLTNYRKKNE